MDSLPTPISLDEAKKTIWPFRELKGRPMGELLNKGLIRPQDLGYALERAYDKRVRDAAKTLLVYSLSDKSDDAPAMLPLNLVSPEHRSFSERRQIQLAMIQGVVAGISLGLALMWMLWSLFLRPAPENPKSVSEILSTPESIIALIILLVIFIGIPMLLMFLFNRVLDRIDREMRLYRKGQQAEERVLNVLYHSLDNNWWVFRNMELPKQKSGDFDFVLVSTKGIWLLEVKAYSGEYRNVGERWETHIGKNWLSSFGTPTKQAKRNAARLSQMLKNNNIKQWIEPIVIWANPDSKLTVENPSIPVWRLEDLDTELSNLTSNRSMPDERREKICLLFQSFYQEPFSEDIN